MLAGKGYVVLNNQTIEALTQYESFSDPALESTTSDGWVVKNNFPYTTTVKEAGTYVLDFSAELGQSKAAKNVGFMVQWREGTSGAWTTISENIAGLGAANTFEYRTGFGEITISTNTVIQVQLLWGYTIETGVGQIKNASIKLGRKGD